MLPSYVRTALSTLCPLFIQIIYMAFTFSLKIVQGCLHNFTKELFFMPLLKSGGLSVATVLINCSVKTNLLCQSLGHSWNAAISVQSGRKTCVTVCNVFPELCTFGLLHHLLQRFVLSSAIVLSLVSHVLYVSLNEIPRNTFRSMENRFEDT